MKKLFFIIFVTYLVSPFAAYANNDLSSEAEIQHPFEDIQSDDEINHAMNEILSEDFDTSDLSISDDSLSRYQHLDPKRQIPTNLLRTAVAVFDKNKNKFRNQRYISIVDFSTKSSRPRFFIVNMQSGHVWAVRTAHGVGGDRTHDGYVESVGNVPDSKKSSEGFFKVSEIYYGKYKRSVRLDGLSKSNSNTRRRAIVIHGTDGIVEKNMIPYRSWGCFSLAWSVKDKVVDKINGGSLLYAGWSRR